MAKLSINLLQADLLSKDNLVTLPRVVAAWAVVFMVMLSWSLLNNYQVNQLTVQDQKLSRIKTNQDALLAQLQAQIQANHADAKVIEELAMLKYLLSNKKVLYRELTDPTHTSVAGFASAMTELSSMHHNDISLEHVNITYQHLTFAGLARSPESVPAWLAKFEHSRFLSGKSFINFTLNENEQKLTEFVVSSKADVGNLNE
jgi:Tfp pilus assembly protein PilN